MAEAARKLRFRLVDASRQSANANLPWSLLVPFILPHDASKFFYPQNSVVKGGRKHQAVSEPLVIKCFFLETRSVLAEL